MEVAAYPEDHDTREELEEVSKSFDNLVEERKWVRRYFEVSRVLQAHEYRILGKKGEGTFSEVLKCQNVKDGTYVACKKMKQLYDSHDQVNNLREIQAMRRLSPHANILELQEVIFDKKSRVLVLVCELMDMNIYELIRGRRSYLPEAKVKHFMYQLCKSLDHMHRNGIFHRDVKPENILIRDEQLKLADFGSCRSIYSKQPYTEYISTRWYRAPECLLTDGYYSYKMDMWSVGCVIYEVLSLHPLFPGSNEVDQIAKIHDVMGTPDQTILNKLKNKTRGMNFNFPQKKGTGIESLLPHVGKDVLDLIYQLCTYDPDERTTARQALRHQYFKDLRLEEKRTLAKAQALKQKEEVSKENEQPPAQRTDTDNSSPSEKTGPTNTDSTSNSNAKSVTRISAEKMDYDKTNSQEKNYTNSQYLNPLLPKPSNLDRRRRRRKHIVAPIFSHGSIYPRVAQPLQHSGFTSAFNTTTFPRIHGNSIMPSLATYRSKPKAMTQPPSKVTYAHYHLPSIAKRDNFLH